MAAGRSVRIGRASAADLEGLADLAARTFRQTFASENTPADMESYMEGAFSLARLKSELEDPASVYLLAWGAEDRPIGYAKLKAGDPAASISGAGPIELQRLYVDHLAIGLGVGSALMEACLAEAGLGGYETLWLGVWERNERAIGFYLRWHFVEVGDHIFNLGNDRQRDLIMQRPVPARDLRSPGLHAIDLPINHC